MENSTMLRPGFLVVLVLSMGNSMTMSADRKPLTIDDLLTLKRCSDPQISPDGRWVVYVVTTITDVANNKSQANLWLVPTDGSQPPRQLTTTEKKDRHPRWSPDSKWILFESNRSGSNQLWVISLEGGEARQLTQIATEANTAIWSRDGRQIAFVSAVYPEYSEKPFSESDAANKKRNEEKEKAVVKARIFKRLFFRHWDSYVEDKRQHLFVISFDPATATAGEPKDVTPGDRDAYPTSTTFSVGDDFTFSPDGRYLVFTAVPSENEAWSTNYDICRVPVTGGSTQWESVTSTNLAADTFPRFSPDGRKMAYRRQQRPGYEADKWDIMVVDVQPDGSWSGAPRCVTSSLDRSVDDFVWASDSNTIFFTAEDHGLVPIWELNTQTQEAQPFLKGGSLSSLSLALSGNRMVFLHAALHQPPRVGIISTQREEHPATLRFFDPNAETLSKLEMTKPENVDVDVEGGVRMQMWILKPPGFVATKKWPVAYLVHGGPQGAWQDGWSFRWNAALWAAQGYVIALPNPRGSTGFGQKFCDEISGDWGGKCYRDLVAGVEYLKRQAYVDPNRMGAAGASFGGYMMNWFAVNEIARNFKCLITHCSVWNFESMWGTTDELWFDEFEHGGLPWEKPGQYREFSPHVFAGNLGKFRTPMLVIHNDLDFRCPIGQGHELFSTLQRQGIKSRFVNFTDEGHWVLKPANSRFWHEEVFAWLKEHVPPGGK
jgi:dipeptidyl aminopeptidase/acylaminoacyl peptidase